MLWTAAASTLNLAAAGLEAGFELKDATPHNQMFNGSCRPVFLDLISFVPDESREIVWRPYGQFIRTYLYPLLANRHFAARLDEILLIHRDGLEPERVSAMCGSVWRRWIPPFLNLVTIPVLLSGRGNADATGFEPRLARDAAESVAVRAGLIRRTRSLLEKCRPRAIANSITSYLDDQTHYSAADLERKRAAVGAALAGENGKILDLGANTGEYSFLAARTCPGAFVVAAERDPVAVDHLFHRLQAKDSGGLSILPLVVDISRPHGAAGWDNAEQAAFLDRAVRARFDVVMALGLMHHLLVSERVPLRLVLGLLSRLTTKKVIVEYVDPADPQFIKIARGRDALHRDLTPQTFEQSAAECGFAVAACVKVNATRQLYTLMRVDR
jgi:SAM-dependent methyltransferase